MQGIFSNALNFNINNLPNKLTETQLNKMFLYNPQKIMEVKKIRNNTNLLLTIGQNSINRIDDSGNTIMRDSMTYKSNDNNSTSNNSKNMDALNAVSDNKDIVNNIKSYFGGKQKTCRKKRKSHRKSHRKRHRKSHKKSHRKRKVIEKS
jgi:hypothetical protein